MYCIESLYVYTFLATLKDKKTEIKHKMEDKEQLRY